TATRTNNTATARNADVIACRSPGPCSAILTKLGGAPESFELRLARHAARGERHHLETGLGDRLVTLATDAVAASLQVLEREGNFFALPGPVLGHGGSDFFVVGHRGGTKRVLDDL